MTTSLIVVDDFLSNADVVRESALKLVYPDLQGAFPGRNSLERIEMGGLDAHISQLTGERL